MIRAEKIQKKAAKTGFDWKNYEGPLCKIREETEELAELLNDKTSDKELLTEELGDMLFSVINLSRHLEIDPSAALQKSTQKFINRYKEMKAIAEQEGIELSFKNAAKLDKIWKTIKGRL
jgi:tetrapyrrole methylase family protein/MazG family protein